MRRVALALTTVTLAVGGTVALDRSATADTSCTPTGLPCQPGVLTAQVEMRTSVNYSIPTGSLGTVPLSGAYWELEYYGLDVTCTQSTCTGDFDDRRWRLMDSGHLDEDGRADISSYYPRNWTDGTNTYFRCAPDFSGPQWDGYYPCSPGHVRVRVYGKNESGTVNVETAPEVVALANELSVVHFWQFEGRQVVTRNLPGGLAYAAAQTVKDVWPGQMADVDIRLMPNDWPNPYYDPQTRLIHLRGPDTFTSTAERLVVERQLHHIYGYDHSGLPGSTAVPFHMRSNEHHAFARGVADFVALTAERRHFDQPILYDTGNVKLNVERCVHESGNVSPILTPCVDGADVAGRVAGVLSDLADVGEERHEDGGLDDRSSGFSVITLVDLLAEGRAQTMDELWEDLNRTPQMLETFWLNTLRRSVFEDVGSTGGIPWSPFDCATCVGHGAHRSENIDEHASARWDLSSLQDEGLYDVWVRTTQGNATLDNEANYELHHPEGTLIAKLDQSTATDGWHNLIPAGVHLIPSSTLELILSGSAATPLAGLVADGMIVAPHDGEHNPRGPEIVTLSGRVHTEDPAGIEPSLPLAGALVEVWYERYDGQWTHLRSGPGDTGDVVRTYLDGTGAYTVTVPYPDEYDLPNGTTWTGCARTDVPFGPSYACGDDKLKIRVYAANQAAVENTDGHKIHVRSAGSTDQHAEAFSIAAGHFFNRPQGQTHTSNLPAAYAYRSAVNVREYTERHTGSPVGDIDITLFEHNSVDLGQGKVVMTWSEARTSDAERLVADKYLYDLTGARYAVWEECSVEDSMFEAEKYEGCAMHNGWTALVASLSENHSGGTHTPVITTGTGEVNLEFVGDPAYAEGSRIPIRVAGVFNDLVDDTPLERRDNFGDATRYDFNELVITIREYEHGAFEGFEEFWEAWLQRQVVPPASPWDNVQVGFLNRALQSGTFDAPSASGPWSEPLCADGACVGGSYLVSDDGASAEMRYDVRAALVPNVTAYDVWVHIPPGSATEDRVDYHLAVAGGVKVVRVDQTARTGWVNLTELGADKLPFALNGEIRVTHGDGAPYNRFVVDGLLVVPSGD